MPNEWWYLVHGTLSVILLFICLLAGILVAWQSFVEFNSLSYNILSQLLLYDYKDLSSGVTGSVLKLTVDFMHKMGSFVEDGPLSFFCTTHPQIVFLFVSISFIHIFHKTLFICSRLYFVFRCDLDQCNVLCDDPWYRFGFKTQFIWVKKLR